MTKVAREVATEDMARWLNNKKIGESTRLKFADTINNLIDEIVEGTLVIDTNCNIIHKLKFPTTGESPIEQLTYKPRIRVSTVQQHLKGVKNDDPDGRVCAHIAALTSNPKGVIQALETDDYSIASDIAIFFL